MGSDDANKEASQGPGWEWRLEILMRETAMRQRAIVTGLSATDTNVGKPDKKEQLPKERRGVS